LGGKELKVITPVDNISIRKMKMRKRYAEEQIIGILKEPDAF